MDSLTRISFFHELYSIILCTCSSNLTYSKKNLSMQKIVKNSKMIQMSIKLKYILQSNVFGLEKYKEAKNSKKNWNFVVRLHKTHGKQKTLPCVLLRRTAKFHVCRAFYVGARQRERKKLPPPRCQRGDDER
jgi:hypothetical protein